MIDYGSLFFATIGTTIPSFVIGIFAIYLFGVTFHVFPFVGWSTPMHWVLPTVILALGPMAFLTRITRASMLEAIRQDYVRTARAKGLREQVVIVTHVMKNAMIPIATIVGPATAGLITGSIIIEGLFSIPGIGRLFLQSILRRDYPLIMATYLLYALLISLANLTVDLVYGVLDPRIKMAK
jgi:ABC-type dipeptide/oligopeptide/nickel transport system permease component